MKIVLAIALLLSVANAASVGTIRSQKALANLVKNSRRLEDNEQDAEEDEDEEYGFLADYSLKFLTCVPDVQWNNPENGEAEYGEVVYRLCPVNDCDDELEQGCKEGYGDYIVGVGTFLEGYLEDMKEQYENDDYDVNEFSECREWEPEDQGDEDGRKRKLDQGQMYYMGPTCTEDGDDIKIGLFTGYKCTSDYEASEGTYESLTGRSMPFSSGGLIPSGCTACYGRNENGEYELGDFCMRNYESSYGNGCETEMESYGNYNRDESACETISELYSAPSSGGRGWVVFLVIVIIALFGIGGYFWWQRNKKKAGAVSGSVNQEGLMT